MGAVPTTTAMYAAGQLYENTSTDEAGNKVIEYKDKEGHIILKKVQAIIIPAAGHYGWLCTYYVYDDLSNLRFVMQPNATNWLATHSWAFETTSWVTSTVAQQYCLAMNMMTKKG
jgi:hypothetical protein